MGVRKKGRRKIVCGGRNYVWYFSEDYDSALMLLHSCSEDKKLVLVYPLSSNYVVSMGRVFQGHETHVWERMFLPLESAEYITPKFVAELIDWAEGEPNASYLDGRDKIVYTDWRGYAFDLKGNKVYTMMY